MDYHAVSSVRSDMDRLDQAQELMAEATALLEYAATAAVEGQGAWCCQTNANRSRLGGNCQFLGDAKLPPLGEGGGAVPFEILS